MRDERDSPVRRLVPAERAAPGRSLPRSPQRARPERVRATRPRARRRRRTRRRCGERPDVPGIADAPERDRDVAGRRCGKSVATEDADHARRVPERRDLPEQLGRRRSRPRRAARPARSGRGSAASTRSSPSAAKRPVSSRCLRAPRSFRTSRSFSLWRDVIRRPGLAALPAPVSSAAFACSATSANACGIGHRDLCERLAVELDPGQAHPGHEAVVREPVRPRGRVDPHDPERAERPLLRLAVAVRMRRASARPAPSRSGSSTSCARSSPSPARGPSRASCARGPLVLTRGIAQPPLRSFLTPFGRSGRRRTSCGSRAYASTTSSRGCGSSSRAGAGASPLRSA